MKPERQERAAGPHAVPRADLRAGFGRNGEIVGNYRPDHPLAYDPALIEHLLTHCFKTHSIPMRGCQPRDLIEPAVVRGECLGAPPPLTDDLLEDPCDGYFVDEDE